jgi:hypothetical protein
VHVFIDESGSFAGFHAGSISVVGALIIPDVLLDRIIKKYANLRSKLPQENGEVKGRRLNEKQVDKVVTLLMRNEERWSRFPEQNGGLAKVDSGLDYAANFSSPVCVA